MAKSNISTSRRFSTRKRFVVTKDCDEEVKMGFISYEDRNR